MKDLKAVLFANKIKPSVFCSSSEESDLFDEDEGRRVFKSIPVNLDLTEVGEMEVSHGSGVLIDVIQKMWGRNLAYSIQHVDIVDSALNIPAPAKLVLTVAKAV